MSTDSCLSLSGWMPNNYQPMVDDSKEKADRQLAERLRYALDASKMTNAKLAEAVGVSEQAVGKWLKTGEIARQRLPVIAKTLNITLEWFLIGTGPMRPEEPLSKEAAELARDWEGLPPREQAAMRAAVRALKKPDTDPVETG